MRQVYPRVYGGTIAAATVAPTIGGLSPRVRGNLSRTGARIYHVRSIPACTGEPRPRLGRAGPSN